MKNEIIIKGQKVTIQEFKECCIKLYTVKNLALHYKCSASTINNKIREAFPGLSTAPRTSIGHKLLELEKKMRCYICKEVHSYENYSLNKHNKNGLSKECKNCAKNYAVSEVKKDINKQYRSSAEGKKLRTASENKRRASKLKRTPKWADLEAIKKFYSKCPEGYHVDHIVPLQGEKVSGLHVLENLQYLPAHENLTKSNKFDP